MILYIAGQKTNYQENSSERVHIHIYLRHIIVKMLCLYKIREKNHGTLFQAMIKTREKKKKTAFPKMQKEKKTAVVDVGVNSHDTTITFNSSGKTKGFQMTVTSRRSSD